MPIGNTISVVKLKFEFSLPISFIIKVEYLNMAKFIIWNIIKNCRKRNKHSKRKPEDNKS